MRPIAAAIAVATIAATAFTVGTRTSAQTFTSPAAQAFTSPAPQLSAPTVLAGPAAAPAPVRPVSRTVPVVNSRPAARTTAGPDVEAREETRRESQPERPWSKTAMIIGGSAASGAGVGAIVDGKKGALIGAAIGGGAASIYEATRRQ
ncbi:MAG TPA: hypothetical protein VFV95_16880 [Vicinamibacterales bacterium]|nr:hypothetical protein [Vicinamibacterales bacterium]